MSNIEQKIIRKLRINPRSPLAAQISQFLRYCNHNRLLVSVEHLELEFKKASSKISSDRSGFENALLNESRRWEIVKSDYSSQLRNYAFLYIAFSLLEDSIRRVIDLYYCSKYGEHWYKDLSNYPEAFIPQSGTPEEFSKQKMLAKLAKSYSGHDFCTKLSFGEISQFIHDENSWARHDVVHLFNNIQNPENPTENLPDLNSCEVYEKLMILQWRRNSVYHHNVIRPTYTIPPRGTCTFSQRNDGKFANTRERIYEIMRYFGLKPVMVLTKIVGNAEKFTGPLHNTDQILSF